MSALPTLQSGFKSTNPHALATILEASETRSIIAAVDIFDVKGIKLWARNQPVSQELQRKLMDRALSRPLETSLIAEDGVRPDTLRQRLQALIEGDGPLTPLLREHAASLHKGAASVRLHPVVQLLLSASEAARPQAFAHAVDAMALAGALMKASGGDEHLVTQAMTAGLLHDIGEMYIAPMYGEADAAKALDVDSFRQLVVHPHVGQLLLTQLTDYPRDLIRAVAEHHEHLDGSGYPHRLIELQISPLGRLMAAAEEALDALRAPGTSLHHASVALRVVPGEFDEHLAGPLAAAARTVPPMSPRHSVEALRAELAQLDTTLQMGMLHLQEWLPETPSIELQRAADITGHLLHKLRAGWNESGLWGPSAIGDKEVAEAEAVQDALRARLLAIERVARLNAGPLSADEQATLDRLCASLTEG
jgi:HD-GYP domain-containing protein (c-di-GMP phosphodiesterase class II)